MTEIQKKMSDYKKSFSILCSSNNCMSCPMNIPKDTDRCYHEGFYREGFEQGYRQAIEDYTTYCKKICADFYEDYAEDIERDFWMSKR